MINEAMRSHTHEITVEAPPEAVWKAITDPTELGRWFPIEGVVEPGEGGSIALSWGEDMTMRCPVEVWEPPKHLRMGWPPHSVPAGSGMLAVDFYVEGRGGSTVLRLVHSGFGSGPEWDQEYDATNRGWTQELGSLGLYMSRHLGVDRHFGWSRAPISCSMGEAWDRLMSPEGLFREGSVAGLGHGDDFSVTMATGEKLAGTVHFNRPPQDFAGVVSNMHDAYFRIVVEDCFGSPEVQIWFTSWGGDAAEMNALAERWTGLLQRLFVAS